MRRARRTDANTDEIVRVFESLGLKVHRTNAAWDLTVQAVGSYPARTVTRLVEIKDGKKPPSKRKLTGPEKELHKVMTVFVVESVDDALRLGGYMRMARDGKCLSP